MIAKKSHTFRIPVPVTLHPGDIDQVFNERLAELKDGRWIQDGKVWEMDYHPRDARPEVVDHNAAAPKWRLLRAVLELEAALL
jgi:hypothetical protein